MRRPAAFLCGGLLIAGTVIACEDAPSPAELVDDAILPGLFPALDRIASDGDLVVVARKGRFPAMRGGPTFPLGAGYTGRVHRPGFVEAWVLVAAEGDDPDCEGGGRKFMKCVKDHLDAGEVCTLHKEGEDNYHAHCEEPDEPSGPDGPS